MNTTSSWWNTWYETTTYPLSILQLADIRRKPLGPWLSDSAAYEKPRTLQEFVLWALSSEDPSIVGLGILSIAVSIKHLDSKTHGYIIVRLPRPAGELFHDCFELVDRLIVNDSEFASSREGIEVIMMSAKLLMDFGLLKKCWVSFLFNLTRPSPKDCRMTPKSGTCTNNLTGTKPSGRFLCSTPWTSSSAASLSRRI